MLKAMKISIEKATIKYSYSVSYTSFCSSAKVLYANTHLPFQSRRSSSDIYIKKVSTGSICYSVLFVLLPNRIEHSTTTKLFLTTRTPFT